MSQQATPPIVSTPQDSDLQEQLLAARRDFAELQSIFDAAPVMLYRWTLSTTGVARFGFVSQGCRNIYGMTPAEMVADVRYSMDVIHPDDLPGFQKVVEQSIIDLSPFNWAGRLKFGDGRIKWIRAQSVPKRNPDGSTSWEGVIVDITEQQQAEQARSDAERERSALIDKLREQNERLVRQSEAMAELSTPIIPLASDVIALPLIGHIDPQRATQILDTLLHGANSHRARIVIIDVTGVRDLDGYGAETLVRAAQGLRLLGATAVLTGLRPAIAQTLVQLGVDFGSLLTRSSFQDGILFALGTRAADGPRRPAR